MSTVISAFERPSKAFYLALNSSRMLKTGFSRKTAVKSQKRGNCRRCHHFWVLEPDAPEKTVKELITKLAT